MPAGTQNASQLRCVRCGLVYTRAAIAREITLATGIDCRRCGGGLQHTDEAAAERTGITAVRASIRGSEQHRFE